MSRTGYGCTSVCFVLSARGPHVYLAVITLVEAVGRLVFPDVARRHAAVAVGPVAHRGGTLLGVETLDSPGRVGVSGADLRADVCLQPLVGPADWSGDRDVVLDRGRLAVVWRSDER